MITKKRFLIVFVAIVYLVTWVGGWTSHAQEIGEEGQRAYDGIKKLNEAKIADAKVSGREPYLIGLREEGPETGVKWAVPLLPGVLLVDSYKYVGSNCARGGLKIVVYYGFGSHEVLFVGWIA